MRVAISPEIFALQRVGGISRYFIELWTALRDTGAVATLWAGKHVNELMPQGTGVIGYRSPAARVRRSVRMLNEVSFRAWCSWQPPDLVVHRSHYDWQGRPACLRMVTTVHDLIPELLGTDGGELSHGSRCKRAACSVADAICVNSQTTADDLRRLWDICPSRIWVTPLGVRAVAASGRDWRSEHGSYLLYVGNRSGYKNFSRLIDAFSQSGLAATHRLLCFGGGPFDAAERCRIGELHLGGRVHHVSSGDGDLAACYQQAAGFVCPSRYEGFGLPVLEAMVQGCPVACARAGALPEVAGDAAIYFDPDHTDSMVEGLRQLAGARGTIVERVLIEHALHFDWRLTALETVKAYEGRR